MVEIKARGAAKTEFTNVNEHFAATNNAEFGLFQQNINRACSALPDSALLVAGKCSFTGRKLRLSDSSRLDSENAEQALFIFC